MGFQCFLFWNILYFLKLYWFTIAKTEATFKTFVFPFLLVGSYPQEREHFLKVWLLYLLYYEQHQGRFLTMSSGRWWRHLCIFMELSAYTFHFLRNCKYGMQVTVLKELVREQSTKWSISLNITTHYYKISGAEERRFLLGVALL